jgi:hypothetical protein
MDGKSTVGTQVRELLDLLERRGRGAAQDVPADERTTVERWDDLTESLLVAHDPRGRTVSEPLAFVEGTLAGHGDLGIEGRYLAGRDMTVALGGRLFGLLEGLGHRWYWDARSGDGAATWAGEGAYADFGFDAVYLLLEDEEPGDAAALAASAGRPFGTRRTRPAPRRAAPAAAGRPAPRAAARPLARPGARRAAAARPAERQLLTIDDTAFSATALPALGAALERVAHVWDEPATSRATGAVPTAPEPMGGRFSPSRFDEALRVVTLRHEATGAAAPAAAGVRTAAATGLGGLGGGETPSTAPVYRFAYDAATDEYVGLESVATDASVSATHVPTPTSASRRAAAAPTTRATAQVGAAATHPTALVTAPPPVARVAARAERLATAPAVVRSHRLAQVVPGAAPVESSAPGAVIAPLEPGRHMTALPRPGSSTRGAGSVAGLPTAASARPTRRAVAAGETPTSTETPSAAPRADRYAYAADLSVLPAELFSTSLFQRVVEEAPTVEARYAQAPSAAHVASPAFVSRPSAVATDAPDAVVYLSLAADQARPADPAHGSGLRSAPLVAAHSLGASVSRRLAAPALTVAEATRLQQILAHGLRSAAPGAPSGAGTTAGVPASSTAAVGTTTPLAAPGAEDRQRRAAAASGPALPVTTATSAVPAVAPGLRALARALGAEGERLVPRALRNTLPAAERTLAAAATSRAPLVVEAGVETAIERALGAMAPRAAASGALGAPAAGTAAPAAPAAAATRGGGLVAPPSHGLWLRLAGMDPIFVRLPASEPAAAATPTAAAVGIVTGPRHPAALDLAQRARAFPLSLRGVAAGQSGALVTRSTSAPAAGEPAALEVRGGVAPPSGLSAAVPAAGAPSVAVPAAASVAGGGLPPLVAAVLRAVRRGQAGAGLRETLAAARTEGAASVAAFAPTVARLLGVTAQVVPGALPTQTLSREETGALLTLERETATATALGAVAPQARGARRAAVPPAAAPELAAWPYLPQLSRAVALRQQERALRMTAAAPVQQFLSGHSATQFARLPVAEQRAVLARLERLAPAAVAPVLASIPGAGAAGAMVAGGRAGDAFWAGFGTRGLSAAAGATPAVGVGLPGFPGGVATAAAALRGAGPFSGAPAGADVRWVRETLELLVPEAFAAAARRGVQPGGGAQGPAAVLARGERLGRAMVATGTPSILAAVAPTSDRLRLTPESGALAAARAAAGPDERATGRAAGRQELGARRALRFAERVTTQVLGAAAEADTPSAAAPRLLGLALPAAGAGRDAAGSLAWSAADRELLGLVGEPPQAVAPVGTLASAGAAGERKALARGASTSAPETLAAPAAVVRGARHGVTLGERAAVGRDWAAAADGLAPLARIAEAPSAAVKTLGATGALGGMAGDPGTLLSLPAPEAALAAAAGAGGDGAVRRAAVGFRPGVLQAADAVGRASRGPLSTAVTSAAGAPVTASRSAGASGAWSEGGPAVLAARFVSWMQQRGVARVAYDRLSPALAEAALLALPGGADQAGAPLGFAFGSSGGGGFAAGVLQRLGAGEAMLAGAGGGASAAGAGTSFGRIVDADGFVRLGGESPRDGGSARLFGGPVGETVQMLGGRARRAADEPGDVRRHVDWGRVGAHTSTPADRGAADLVGLASAATMGRELSRSALPLVAPMVQAVARQAAAKPSSAAPAESAAAGAGAGKADSAGRSQAEDEKKKIRKVVDQVVGRLTERLRTERERRGGHLW